MDVNLRLVRYLMAVVEEGHFGRAADRLFISAPALSQQVRRLERDVGADLLDRSAHPIRPTLAGEMFLEDARVAVASADRAVAAVASFVRGQAATVTVGFMSAIVGPRTRELLDAVRAEYPEVLIQLQEVGWPQQATAVRDGRVDAAIVRPPFPEEAGVRFDVLWHEPRVATLPVGHRLADRTSVQLADLDADAHVSDDEVDPSWLHWWACDPRPSGVPVRYGPPVRTMDELLETVASGGAIAITGASVPESYRHPGIVFVPIVDAEPCPVSLCTRVGDTSILVTALRRAARTVRGRTEPAPSR